MITFACDDVRYKRKDRPEVWIAPEEVNGKMFIGYPFVSFIPGSRGDEQPVQYGDFVIDVDTQEIACSDSIKIIQFFEDIFGITPDQWKIYLSGKKGCHLALPSSVIGVDSGHKYLMVGYKRLGKEIEGELGVKLDLSMYTMGTPKPFRNPNVMRDTGTCKRQIEYSDLYEIQTEEEYREACSEPGPTWEPADTERNEMLAAKVAGYLKEAEKHQESLKNSPVLSDDERDRLALTTPPCIAVLANLTSAGNTSRTFNDVAIQLTAYAITAGRTEQEFLDGCHVFISGYPSTSLNTPQKRIDNCRARYRTMAANGNQHSCGGIKALGFPGFDCKECKAMPNGPPLTVEVMDERDLERASATLCIPDNVLNPGGLISLAMEALPKAGAPDIPQFALPAVLTVLANAIAGKLQFERCWPNVYNVKVGSTSLGKTETDKAIRAAIEDRVPGNFYGPTGFASGPALMRSLVDEPKTMLVLDECTNLFKRYQHADPLSDGIRDALLEIYSNSGGKIRRVYSDSKKSINVDYPCVSLTGNATPVIFEAIKAEDFATGTMQRFDFWCYDGPAMERNDIEIECAELNQFAEAVARIYTSSPPGTENLAATLKVPYCVKADEECREVLREWSKCIIAAANKANGDGEKGIISRKYNLAIKYALIHMAGTRPVESIYQPMRLADIEYGKAVATMLADWKLGILMERVSQGDFHHSCQVFKSAIVSAMKNGKRPTFKVLTHRRPELKNWRMKESLEVITVLSKRGEIALDESKRPTAYYLVKGEK